MKFTILGVLLSILIFSSCEKESNDDSTSELEQTAIDDSIINQYLDLHPNINATKHSSGLYYQIIRSGSGPRPTLASNVTVRYKGYLTSGNVFDQTTSADGISFALANLIEGWKIGIPLVKRGGRIKLLVPSKLGYGSRATGSIPAHSVLIFEIDLVNVY